MRRGVLIVLALSCLLCGKAQGDYDLQHVIEDIYVTAVEAGVTEDFEEMQEALRALSEQKININQATSDDLRQLYFLDEEQIDKILVYRDLHPLHSVYELQLIPGLKEWEYRFLALFVEAGKAEKPKLYVRDVFQNGKHEVVARADARNIEGFTGDPVYASLKYRFQSMNKLAFGITAERDAGEPWWGKKTYGFDYYGGHFQLNDVWKFKTIVAGDYRVQYGLGLTVSGSMRFGKTSYISNLNFGRQGLRRYTGVNESQFFRGAGTTLRLGPVDASVWYSYKKVDANVKNGRFPSIIQTGYHRTDTEISHKRTVGQHVIGANVTYNYNNLRVGVTAQEMLLSDTLRPTRTFYNERYFTGKRQAVVGAFAFWHYGRMELFGEVATAQNTHWGVGTLVGSKVQVVPDVELLVLGRYYSPWFDNMYAGGFGETSKNNDELGLFASVEVLRLKNWRFAMYGDVFHFSEPKYGIRDSSVTGFELQGEAEWQALKELKTGLKVRWKRKGGVYLDRVQGRYLLEQTYGGWHLETALEGTLCGYGGKEKPTLGYAVRQDVAYHFERVPIVLLTRLEWFDAQNWNNRIYSYEHDVLYAYSIPATYGQGGRWYLNARWKIGEHFGLYLKVAETIYTKRWMQEAGRKSMTQTDIHLLLRIVY
ncbi:MAG: helix-hairpin-helix domain-containing protein [Paludibacteraceae bacterium]|nr:helix-hairpin-helix domain-containing protein [Paludibacteraceae bacterium]